MILLAMTFWGANWIASKMLAVQAEPNVLVFWRFTIAVVAFIPPLIISKSSFKVHPEDRLYLGIAALCLIGYQWSLFRGLSVGYASIGGIIVTTLSPVITNIVENLRSKTLLSKQECLGLTIGTIGAAVLIQVWTLDLPKLFSSGNIFFLAGAVLWASITILSQKCRHTGPMAFTFYLYAPGVVIASLLCSPSEIMRPLSQGLAFIGPLLYVAIIGTVVATTWNFKGISIVGTKKGSAFTLLIPSIALLLGWLVLHEPLTLTILFGSSLTLAGVYVITRSR